MNNDNNDNHDDDVEEEDDFDEQDQLPLYVVDTDTATLIETAIHAMMSMADCQIDPNAAEAMMMLADDLAARFGIDRFEVVETIHTDDDGEEEIIYTPKGGSIMPDIEEEEDV